MGWNELIGYSWSAQHGTVIWTWLSKSSEIKFVETNLTQYAQYMLRACHSYSNVIYLVLATAPCLLPKSDYRQSYKSTLRSKVRVAAYYPHTGRLLKRLP